MNYIIEDNFDFFKELNGMNDDKKSDNLCMISHLPLIHNAVTLPCEHTFNYLPLYTELCLHNDKKKISCPYCRKLSDKLIPFIPLPEVNKVIGVNYPLNQCLPAPHCTYILKNGKTKGSPCGKNGIETDKGTLCMKHSIVKENDWTTEMEKLSREKSVVEIKQLLREKGLKVCGVKKELVKRLMQQI